MIELPDPAAATESRSASAALIRSSSVRARTAAVASAVADVGFGRDVGDAPVPNDADAGRFEVGAEAALDESRVGATAGWLSGTRVDGGADGATAPTRLADSLGC